MEKAKKVSKKKNVSNKKGTTNIKKINIKSNINKEKELLDNKNYKNAENFYKTKDYKSANKIYLLLTVKYSKNKKVYKRLIETLTEDYTYKENNKEFKSKLNNYITTYKLLANKKELKYFEKKLSEYDKIKVKNSKSKFLLISIVGFFGIHKFMEKKYVVGIAYLLSFGFFGIGVIIDLINDYAEYEDERQLTIYRYCISFLIILFGILRFNIENFYYFILIGILLLPIIYSKILKIIPNFIKVIAVIILCYLGFKTTPVIISIPTEVIGSWKTENDYTNFKSIKIGLEHSSIKFNDRKTQEGYNEYDDKEKILTIFVDAKTFYRFRYDKETKELCTYNETKKCIVSFKK